MGRKKLIRFEEIKNFSNVFADPADFPHLRNVTLELACGKGEYALALAEKFPKRTFVGVDRKGDRIWVGASKALAEGINNLFFIKDEVARLPEYFQKNNIEEIWITFPDPHPTKRGTKKRLIAPSFLEIYRNLLKKNGAVHLKTDSDILVNYAEELELNFEEFNRDIYQTKAVLSDVLTIKTTFEKKHLAKGAKIAYLRFKP